MLGTDGEKMRRRDVGERYEEGVGEGVRVGKGEREKDLGV
jgi:hypothetical protein